jgi:hypothetical protein
MGKRIEMEGRVFGRLVVIDVHSLAADGTRMYQCLCECGGYRVVRGTTLRKGITKSCGCLQRSGGVDHEALRASRAALFATRSARLWGRLAPLSQRFDELAEEWWLCRCECGVTREFRKRDVMAGCSRSCGCLRREVARTTATEMHASGRSAAHTWRASFRARKEVAS